LVGQNAGTLNVNHSIIERNFGIGGGAISNTGTLSLTHSILAANTAQEGGGVLNLGSGTAVLDTQLSSITSQPAAAD
jgi:hypothetical protein